MISLEHEAQLLGMYYFEKSINNLQLKKLYRYFYYLNAWGENPSDIDKMNAFFENTKDFKCLDSSVGRAVD